VDSPGTLAVDLANNRILVASVRNNLPRIAAISLSAPYTVTTFLTPAPVNGATSSTLAGIAIPGAPAPTTISSINRGSTNPSNAGSVNYTVIFAASVTGLTISNFDLVTSGVSGATINSLSGSGTTYTVSVNTGSGSGTLTLRLLNATGLSPSISTTLPFTGETYTTDKTAPIPTITSSAGNPTTTSPIPFTVTFSESVTGFVAGDVTVTNGTLSGFSGSGTTYTFNVTPSANGTVTVNVPANVAQDAAGNGNTAAASQFTITYAQPLTAAPVVIAP
ncbi:Ig-like domain-containing protein, partial [Spirosoma utsteinense]